MRKKRANEERAKRTPGKNKGGNRITKKEKTKSNGGNAGPMAGGHFAREISTSPELAKLAYEEAGREIEEIRCNREYIPRYFYPRGAP